MKNKIKKLFNFLHLPVYVNMFLFVLAGVFLCSPVYAVSNDVYIHKGTTYASRYTDYSDSSANISSRLGWYYGTEIYGLKMWTPSDITYNDGDILQFQMIIVDFDSIEDAYSPNCMTSGAEFTVFSCDVQVNNMKYIHDATLNMDNIDYYNASNGGEFRGNIDATYNSSDMNVYYFNYKIRSNRTQTLSYIRLNSWFLRSRNNIPHYWRTSDISISSSFESTTDAINDLKEQQQEQHDEDKQAIEDAQQDAQQDGSQSQTDATNTGQTLLQAFQSFIGAITSAQPSNCNLPMDTGYIDFGTVNLCQLSPPPAFQAISSIVVIGFAVPLSIAASKKMIELFRSFTG